MRQRWGVRTVILLVVWLGLACCGEVFAQRRVPYAYDNQAVGKESYMVRLTDSLPPASYGNDGDLSTIVRTTDRSVDGYWEVDLEQEYAVYHVQVDVPGGYEARMTHATVRLFDENHDSVFSMPLPDSQRPAFYVDCGGPRRARYVRVGFEHKERSSPDGGIEWALGIKEVMVIARPANEVGLLSLESSAHHIQAGDSVSLTWRTEDVASLELSPNVGSVLGLIDEDGVGFITLAPEESTEYRLMAEGAFGREIKYVTVVVDDRTLPVRINEFVARNQLSLEDGFGDSADWIELYNPNETAIDLSGYGLSDDVDEPMKWIFPEVGIPAHTHLIVFASDSDEAVDPEGNIHANWRLDGDGESIVLTAPDGVTVIDEVIDYPPQREDLAYGRDDQGNLTFIEPTPGQLNLAQTYEGWLSPLEFSHERGFHDAPFELSINHGDTEAEILYSFGGGVPRTYYRHPVAVTGTNVVRATVTRHGYKSPRLQTHTYLFIEDIITSNVMNQSTVHRYTTRLRDGLWDLPSIAIAVPGLPDDYREHEASVEILWPDGAEPIQANCGIVRYGGAWTTFAKKSYRLKFRRQYGAPKLRAPLFDGFDHGFPVVDVFDEVEFAGGSHDMNQRGFYMAGRFVEDSMLDMGSLNPHGRFVHLYLNGVYWGQFHMRERLVEHFLADYLGGASEDYLNVRGNDNVGSSFIPGTPDPIHRYSWQRVRALAGSYQDVRAYVDVSSLIDFTLLWFYGNCESEYRASGPVDAGSGFKFWMADADGFLRTSALNQNRTSNSGPGGLFGALVSERDPDFMTLLADRIYRHMHHDGALTPQRNEERLLDRMGEIQDSLIAECARWGYRTPDSWNAAAGQIINQLFPGRTERLLGQLRGRQLYPNFDPPKYSQRGGSVEPGFELTLSAGAGTIYYTVDGNDPRLPGGQVAPSARAYGAVSATTEALVPAGATWRYWDQGTEPAGSWRSIGYNDSAWDAGRAQLGYGDGDEATVISYGPNSSDKHLAYYFRHSFSPHDMADVQQVILQVVRDDGVVVYLNGIELMRDNMPAGDITAETTASSAVGSVEESEWFRLEISPDSLIDGTNVLAVEVHQSSRTSSDISFDLTLQATRTQDQSNEGPIVLTGNTVLKSRVLNGSQWSALNEAHFNLAE